MRTREKVYESHESLVMKAKTTMKIREKVYDCLNERTKSTMKTREKGY